MTINQLLHFAALHKARRSYQPCPIETVQRYRGIISETLTNTWEESGFQEFSNGFLWSVNPDAFRDVVSAFVHPYQLEAAHVLFRTGFGDLIIDYKGKIFHLSAMTLVHSELTGSIEQVLEMHLGQREFANAIFFLKEFRAAGRRLGPPSESEVYASRLGEPLRGALVIETLQRLDLREHMLQLSRIVRPRAF